MRNAIQRRKSDSKINPIMARQLFSVQLISQDQVIYKRSNLSKMQKIISNLSATDFGSGRYLRSLSAECRARLLYQMLTTLATIRAHGRV